MSTEGKVIISNYIEVYVPYKQRVKGLIVKKGLHSYYLSANLLGKILGCSISALKKLVKHTSPNDFKQVVYNSQTTSIINIDFLLLTYVLQSHKHILRNVKYIRNYVDNIEDFYTYILTFVQKSEENYKQELIQEKNVKFCNESNIIPPTGEEDNNPACFTESIQLTKEGKETLLNLIKRPPQLNTNLLTTISKTDIDVQEPTITKLVNDITHNNSEIKAFSDIKSQLYLEINQQEDHVNRLEDHINDITNQNKLKEKYYLETGILYGLQSAYNLINNLELQSIRDNLS